jgi:hypothetical protein
MKFIHIISFIILSLLTADLGAQSTTSKDPFQALSFLEGTWDAKTNGSSGVQSIGEYSFELQLQKHVLSRQSVSKGSCKGPDSFDCNHSDMLYIYPSGADGALQAIYFDNEGHVIKYQVSTPTPTTALFQSDSSLPGPQFQLVYERRGDTMSGKFQMRMPGQGEWKSYLEWSGQKY